MSTTRISNDPSKPLSYEKWMSSPEFAALRPIPGNAVLAKAMLYTDPKARELAFFLQAMSMRSGGLRAVAEQIVEWFPERCRKTNSRSEAIHALADTFGEKQKSKHQGTVEALSDFLIELSLNPELSLSNIEAPCFQNLGAALRQYKAVREKAALDGFVLTTPGNAIFETLDQALGMSRMVVVEGNAGTGKTTNGKAWISARPGMEVSSQQAVAGIEENSAAQSRAREVAEAYHTSIFVAAQALDLLGASSATAAVGSAQMDAAIESATRATMEANAQRAAYNASLRESTAAMLAEVAALDADASAEEKRTVLTAAVTAALQRMGLTEAEVAFQANKMNTSFDATARAMLQIKQAELATEVAQIRAEMEGVTVAAADNVTGLEAVRALLIQTGTQRHVLTSIREIARGGAYTIRGEAEATFLLGNALNALLPGVGIVIAVASGVALVAQILEEHATKAAATANKIQEKTDATANSSKEYADAIKSTFAEATRSAEASFSSIGGMYETLTRQITATINAAKELQRAQDELTSAKLAAQIAVMDAQEEQASQGKTPEQQAVIKRQYEARRLNLRQGFDEDKAATELAGVKQDLAEAQTALANKTKELSDQENKYEDALKSADNAQEGLRSNGVQSDADYAESQAKALRDKGNSGVALSYEENMALQGYEDRAPALRRKESDSGPQFSEQIERLTTALQANEKIAAENPGTAKGYRAFYAAHDIKDQMEAIAYYQSAIATLSTATKDNAKDQLEGRAATTELAGKVDALAVRVQAAELKVAGVKIADATQQQQLQDRQTKEEAQAAFEQRQADRDAKKKPFETQADDLLATPDQRAQAKATVDEIDNEGIADKLANAVVLGISKADQTRLNADYGSYKTKAVDTVAGQNNKDLDKEERPLVEGLQKSLTEQAKGDPTLEAQLRALIEAHKGETPTQQYLAIFKEYNEVVLTAKQKDQGALQIMGQMLIEFKTQIVNLQRKTNSILNGRNN